MHRRNTGNPMRNVWLPVIFWLSSGAHGSRLLPGAWRLFPPGIDPEILPGSEPGGDWPRKRGGAVGNRPCSLVQQSALGQGLPEGADRAAEIAAAKGRGRAHRGDADIGSPVSLRRVGMAEDSLIEDRVHGLSPSCCDALRRCLIEDLGFQDDFFKGDVLSFHNSFARVKNTP